MTRAIEYITEVPDESSLSSNLPRKFIVAALYVLTYAPDRESSGSFRKLRTEFEKYFGLSAKLEDSLEREFFSSLYIERNERQEIEDLIPGRRLILVHGLVGVGKTVVLRKIGIELEKSKSAEFMYFDFKAITEALESASEAEFPERFEQYVYNKIFEDYVAKSEILKEKWKIYKILHDRAYVFFRQWVYGLAPHTLSTENDWKDILNYGPVQEKYNSLPLDLHLDLTTLLLFLKDHFPYILCFDNVDRHPIKLQRRILSKALDISNGVQVPVIVAIRESNLKRIISEGDSGDLFFTDLIERVKAGEEKGVKVRDLPDPSIQALLARRLAFLQREGSGALSDFIKQIKRERTVDLGEYNLRFWKTFNLLADTFVESDVYRYCNHNLRHILKMYFQLVSRTLDNPEKEYSVYQLVSHQENIRTTKLRNYLYKWLICADGLIPKSDSGLLNIYRHCVPNLRILDLRILEFLYNWRKRHPDDKLQFSIMALEFNRFGIRPEVLKDHLEELTRNQGEHELGLVWYDGPIGTHITEETIVELLPAGDYFLRVASISREYAFWNALTADLDQNIIGHRFTLSETYKDGFKLDVVYKFTQKVLLPAIKQEMEHFDKSLVTPRGWDGSNLAYYMRIFTVDGHTYPYRLLNSVLNTIDHTAMRPDRQAKYKEKYNDLLNEVYKLEVIGRALHVRRS